MADQDSLSPGEHERILREEILPDVGLSDRSSLKQPRAVILAGQPGAGKGGLAGTAASELHHDAVIIDPDALRGYHSDVGRFRAENPYSWSGRTHRDASLWADELLELTAQSKKNLIFDTTLSNGQWASELIQDLQARGYEVEVRAIAAPKLESELGVDKRFSDKVDTEGHGRYVPEGARNAIYSKLPDSLDTVHARTTAPIRIFNREGIELYDSRIDARAPGQALDQERVARLKDPAVTQRVRQGWEEQHDWHRDLPQNLRNNPNIAAETQLRLLDERRQLKVADGILPQVEGIATLDELVRPGAAPARAVMAEPMLPGLHRAATLAGASTLGLAASAYDASETGQRVSTLLAQDNPLAAQSALTHYAARGAGGWVGGAVTGFAVGWGSGPAVIGFVAVGAVAGSQIGENVATWWDNKQIYEHKDQQGVDWEFDGRQWLCQEQADLNDDGVDAPTTQSFSALPDKARELNFKASSAATELAFGRAERPRDPYDLPANDKDSQSLGDANWKRNADTGDWQRETIVARTDRGHPLTRTDIASPERAAELEREAGQVVQANIAAGPAPIAARYQLAYKACGWHAFGQEPSAVAAALDGDRLSASDEKTYRRDDAGQWRTDSGDVARGNIARELDGMREQLRPALAQHAEQLAAMPVWTPPTRDELDRINLRSAYEAVGVAPHPERFEAALEAVRRTREAQGVDPSLSSLYLWRNDKNGYDTHSPIVHLARDAKGVHIAAVTSAQEIELALLDLRGMDSPAPRAPAADSPTPDAPELRIAALSPQQRDAQEQMIREANRQGASNDQMREVAAAVAAVPVGAEGAAPVREAEAVRAVARPESGPTAKTVDAPPPAPAPTPAPPQPAAVAAAASMNTPLPPSTTVAEAVAPAQKAQEATRELPASPDEPARSDIMTTKPSETDAPARPVPVPDAPTAPVAQPEAVSAPDDDRLRAGDRGQEVELLQYRLHRIGYRDADGRPLPQDGRYDTATEQAVRQFQRDRGLADTGVADSATQQAMSAAQHARIESQKAAGQDAAAAPAEPAPAAVSTIAVNAAPVPPVESAPPRAYGHAPQALDAEAPAFDRAPGQAPERPVAAAARSAASETSQPIAPEPSATDAAPSSRAAAEQDRPRLSAEDQAMYAKIRAGAPAGVSDEHVAALLLAAKRNGVQTADEIKLVAVAGDTLWLDRTTPGFHTGVELDRPAPALHETARDTQAFNQRRDQQLAQDAAQRGQDDPGRGPKV
ncbi:zeta toxin family protein [Lysobacter enzymogenes]|uniref:zeta toxin family protein n=1 Tax=Lysobacter enzymogenes TaxID=69 RepID=UPI00089AD997|nr:zeta toxin family protein [Lysobacter enzymogenes]SDY13000.1 Putative peptidoglycan binding domain-containing protein [Lysobacter enzymogenes]